MALTAPEMEWDPAGAGSFKGFVPIWPFERAEPPDLIDFLAGRRLRLSVRLLQGHPMIAPRLLPLDPEPPLERRLRERWHLNADGSLCLLFSHASWSGRETAAELVRRSAGWFIEYLLVDAGSIEKMTELGPITDLTVDGLLGRGS